MVSERWLKSGLMLIIPAVVFGIISLSRGGQRSSTVLSAWLSPDIPAQISLPLGTASQIYGFRANPNVPTHLMLDNPNPGLSFTAEVRGNGQRVAVLGGGMQNAVLTLGPGEGLYEVEFKSDSGGMPGSVSLMVSDTTSALADTVSPPSGVCSLSSAIDAGVNIRSGPSFDYTVLGVLPHGSFLTPDARSENGWYRVYVNAQDGWVLGSMVNLHGPCQDLLLSAPIPSGISVTPMPVAQMVPCNVTPASTVNVNVRSGPGTTFPVIGSLAVGSSLLVSGRSDNDWYTVTAGGQQGWVSGSVVTLNGLCDELALAAPTPLPTPLPIAPYDTGTFSLVADRDGGNQVSEVISYPDGDRADLIEVDVANLYFQPPDNYREFALSLQCTGTGAEFVRWGAPENPMLACGSSITLPFLYDYSAQTLAVTLPQGPGYVSYTLSASVIR